MTKVTSRGSPPVTGIPITNRLSLRAARMALFASGTPKCARTMWRCWCVRGRKAVGSARLAVTQFCCFCPPRSSLLRKMAPAAVAINAPWQFPTHEVAEAHTRGCSVSGPAVFGDHLLATRATDDTLKLWDLRNFSAPLAVRTGLPNICEETGVAFSPGRPLPGHRHVGAAGSERTPRLSRQQRTASAARN